MNEIPSANRLPALDFLRAAAVILVLLFHTNNKLEGAPEIIRSFFSTGWNGVFLFFVLSGFLIGRLTFKELKKNRHFSLSKFWLRRIFRTWPLYFVLLGIAVWRAREISPSLIHFLTFTQNFYSPNILIQSWSLAIEEQFYLFFPLVVLILWKTKKESWTPWICVGGIISAYIFRYHHLGDGTHTFATIDSLLCGILLAYLDLYKPSFLAFIRKNEILFSVLGIALVYIPFLLPQSSPVSQIFLQGFLGLGFGLLLTANTGSNPPFSRLGRLPGVSFIAMVSYSIYLAQDRPLFWSAKLSEHLGLTGWTNILLIFFTCTFSAILVGAILYHLIEKPALRIRDRFFHK